MDDRLTQYELDHTLGITIRPRNKRYKDNDAAIRRLVIDFDAIANPTNDQYTNHLRALQYRLAKNQFDEWD
jgi:hypothetical protein